MANTNKGELSSLSEKGFGFIKVEGKKNGVFFHAKDLKNGTRFDSLAVGDPVTFDSIEMGEKGEKAHGVDLAY